MVLVDLGRPPGFTLHAENLAALRDAGTIAEYEFTDKRILIDQRQLLLPVSDNYFCRLLSA